MIDFFKKNKPDVREEWNAKGEQYAKEINEMVEFGEKNGWENWKGKEPEDKRDHLAEEVIRQLKLANLENRVERFRNDFPPSHAPLISFLEKQAQSIEQLHFINDQKIVFLQGTAYQKRQAYILNNDQILELDINIKAIGKSKQDNIFAIATESKISTFKGWEGELIREFILNVTAKIGITELIPFNDGNKLLIVTSEGIYLVSENEEKLIHPLNEGNEEEWSSNIDMENATLSNDNTYIVVGDQCYDHRILDANGNTLGSIGPQSSYPHFSLFSKDDSQLITNSCHFYNGLTIGIDSDRFIGVRIEEYSESDDYKIIDEEMRVYVGLATSDYYILGDAYGNIRAIDKNGKKIWRHFLGSTISGMTISDDEQSLWIGTSGGILHKLRLGKGHRDKHTIGNGNHYEDFRLLIWKNEPQIWKW
ncbi:hypothetical protein [Sphingobacterium lactis]|uniref:PQQ-like domain-containing protein n=1 Tax=Sphingobacterium lactis TaxID=797291 RepID=A0A1H6CGA0_9SPHI|nr:hypothetical protein [Sphingobacterium lactis]SEG71817.1 hypothetical protein SAMN05421877_11550 [Sphingobacterium lactis]